MAAAWAVFTQDAFPPVNGYSDQIVYKTKNSVLLHSVHVWSNPL